VQHTRTSQILALGFGTTVAMWAAGYVLRFPGVNAPSWFLLAALLSVVLAGGFAAGRVLGRLGGLQAGLLAGALNLLILGSVLTGSRPGELIPSAAWWIPGSLAICAGIGLVGASLAGRRRDGAATLPLAGEPLAAFAAVAAAATFLLLVAGGIVTSAQAGLAVADWPRSYGYNMFLYPLARMTGGIYYEHVHRLLGSLVGLTTVVLAVHLLVVEKRGWVKAWGLGEVALVIVQGMLGGLRVTETNLGLAVVHGIVGQLFFGSMVALAAVTTRRWQDPARPLPRQSGRSDHHLTAVLLVVLLVQLLLGALLRHLDAALELHLTLAAGVIGLGASLGIRLLALYGYEPLLRRLGRGLLILLGAQLCLGFAALVARGLRATDGSPHGLDVTLTTLHQAVGALLLAVTVLAALWVRRLVQPLPEVVS
jgi:heme a synthase